MVDLDATVMIRRDKCVCGQTIGRNILGDEPWAHWRTGLERCRPGEGDRSPVATPRRTSPGDVQVAGTPQDGGES